MNNKFFTFVFLFSLALIAGCREKLNLTDPQPGMNQLITNNDNPNVLYLTTPAGGEVLTRGILFRIRWFVSPSVRTVALSLFRKEQEITAIAGSTENDGLFNWTIPTNIPASSNYRIKLSNPSSMDEFIFSDYFTISAPVDSVQ